MRTITFGQFFTVLGLAIHSLLICVRLTLPLKILVDRIIRSIFLLKFVAIMHILKKLAYIFGVIYFIISKNRVSLYILTCVRSKGVMQLWSCRQQL